MKKLLSIFTERRCQKIHVYPLERNLNYKKAARPQFHNDILLFVFHVNVDGKKKVASAELRKSKRNGRCGR